MNRKIGMLITLIKQHVSRLLEKMLVEYGIDEFNGPQGRILYVLWTPSPFRRLPTGQGWRMQR